ncbi:MAG: MFS transporter [Ferrimicrobium sp.]
MAESQYWKLYVVDSIRTFGLGYFAIIYVIAALNVGMGALDIGILTTVSVVIGMGTTRIVEWLSSSVGPRSVFLLAGCLMLVTGLVLFGVPGKVGIIITALFGFLPPIGGQFVAAAVEGCLAHAPVASRTKVFARYELLATGAGAIGALAGVVPNWLGASQAASIAVLSAVFGLLGLMVILVSLSLPREPSVSSTRLVHDKEGPNTPIASQGRANVRRLMLLFIADSTGSGIVAPTLLVYWLHVYFHLSLPELSGLYFAMDILSAVSFPLAEYISRHIGLLNTAVFTHIPSSLLLVMVPFAPNAIVAISLLLGRALLVEMDVPTRKSYIASIVPPELRAYAAYRTSMGSQAGKAIGPLVGGVVLSSVGNTVPFILGGAMKISYDITLWLGFRRVARSDYRER